MSESTGSEKAVKIMRDARFCMVTVTDREGALVARPMTPQEVSDSGEVWFFIARTGEQAAQIGARPQVNLAFSESSTWLSVSGEGHLVEDRAKVDELWSSVVEAWFPNGKDDPSVALLHVRGSSAEYWDSPGGRAASAFSFVKAKVTGDPIRGENESVELD